MKTLAQTRFWFWQLAIIMAGSATVFAAADHFYGWGRNDHGQVAVSPDYNITAVALGGYHTLLLSGGAVIGLGWNLFGQTNIPASATNVVAIAAGDSHSLALKADGTVVGWGNNDLGQTNISVSATNVVAIASGLSHGLALKADGTVVGWGWNAHGETVVPDSATNVVAIAAGYTHSLALRANGTVVGWGQNGWGQITIPSSATNVVAIAAGSSHSLSLKADGTVVGWGYNAHGETVVPASATNVVAIAAGYYHSLALKADGTVVVWGANNYGQLSVPAGLSGIDLIGVGCMANHVVAVSTVWVPPEITTPPQSRTNVAGTTADFTVGATGTDPLSYQWRFNGTPVGGATTSLYSLASVQSTNAGSYDVVVTNVANSVTSQVATLTVLVPATIVQQPESRTVAVGSNVTFLVSATGTAPLSYQWRFNQGEIGGATDSMLALTNVQTNNAGSYDMVVSNTYGMTTSAVATLAVWHPPAFIHQPESRTVIVGSSVLFTAEASGEELTYQWRFNGGDIDGATNSTLFFGGLQTDNAGTYSVAASNLVGFAISSNAVLTVAVPPRITVQPQSQVVRTGVNATFNVTATGIPQVSYQWLKNGVNLSAATNSSYTILNVLSNHAGSYSVAVSNGYGSVISSNAVLTVDIQNPTITITAPTAGQRWSNEVFTVRGTARDNTQVSNVWCQLNGGDWAAASSTNGWTNWTANAMLTPGTNTVRAWTVDTAGNKSTTNSVSFFYVVTNQLQVQATGQGTLSPNYSNAWLEIGRAYTNTATGINGHVFTNWVISTNWVGGVTSNSATLRFIMQSNLTLQVNFVDVQKPGISITNPPTAKTYTNAQTVTIWAKASDNVGVTKVEFYDGSTPKGTNTTAPYSYQWTFNETNNGAHVWTARAYDAAGNVSNSSPVTLTVSIDITPPTVAITTPTNNRVFTTNYITVTGTASDLGSATSGVSVVQVRLNSGNWSNATGTTSWSRAVTLSPCTNSIEARSRDKAGNYSTNKLVAVTYNAPNTVPDKPTNLFPANGAVNVSVTPTLQAGAFSDSDCAGDTHTASRWQVLNSGGSVVVADSGTNTVDKLSWTVPAGKLYYGSNYQWRVRYRDSRNGWSSNSVPTTFTTGGPWLSCINQDTNMVFKWPTNALGFNLVYLTNLSATSWTTSPPSPVIVNGQYTVTNSMTNNVRFYRLKK